MGMSENIIKDFSGYIPLFRGTGKRGLNELKATSGGVRGDGAYFYTEPLPARSHASYPNGGVITGYAKPEDLDIYDNVAVLKDVSKFIPKGKLSLEDTVLPNAEYIKKAENALTLKGATAIAAGSTLLPKDALAAKHKQMAEEQALQDAYSPVDMIIAGATGGATMGLRAISALADPVINYAIDRMLGD
jgi:hypothetical protein